MKNKNNKFFKNNNYIFFNEKKCLFFESQTAHESFQALPENITKDKLQELKKQIGTFDKRIDKVDDLNIKLDEAADNEKKLIDQVKKRFNNYLDRITELEQTDLSEGQKELLEDIKKMLEDLQKDLNNFDPINNKDVEFHSEYREKEEFFKKIVSIWLSPYYKPIETVPFEGSNETFTEVEKTRILNMFSPFNQQQINILVDVLESKAFINDNKIDLDSMELFLNNLNSNKKVKEIFFKFQGGRSNYGLSKIILKNPNNLITLYKHLGRNLLDLVIKIYYTQSSSIFASNNLDLVLEMATIFLGHHSDRDDNLAHYIYNNPKYKNHPDLQEYFKRNHSYIQDVQLFEGVDGMKAAYEDTLTSKTGLLGFASVDDLHEVIPDYIKDYYIRRADKGVHMKVIFPFTKEAYERSKNDNFELRTTAFIPKDLYAFGPEINIYDDKILMVSLKEKIAIIVKNKELAHALRKMHDLAWLQATKEHEKIIKKVKKK